MKYKIFSTAVAVTMALAGCSTVLDRSTQFVEVVTPDVLGADCSLATPDHKYSIETPGDTLVEKSRHDIEITCKKYGYHDTVLIVPSTYNPRTALNVFNGILPGTAYDFASKAVYHYPERVEVFMEPLSDKFVKLYEEDDSDHMDSVTVDMDQMHHDTQDGDMGQMTPVVPVSPNDTVTPQDIAKGYQADTLFDSGSK